MSRSATQKNWSFPESLQPHAEDLAFDLGKVLDAVVQVRSEVPEDAYTASFLGTERLGSGVVIREDGLVLTVGYLVTEASSVWLTNNRGQAVPAHPLAHDGATGFGLVLPLAPLATPVLPRGSARTLGLGDPLIVAGHGGRAHALKAKLVARREFAGYWEYVLDDALFSAPAHPQWGGTAVVDRDGMLVGIGSLLLQELTEGKPEQGNMAIPIDLLEPILDDLVRLGRPDGPPRPWVGLFAQEVEGRPVVGGLAASGPADRAGVRLGDVVLEVAGRPVKTLVELFRAIWACGPAGVEIPLTVHRKGARLEVMLKSSDRNLLMKKPALH